MKDKEVTYPQLSRKQLEEAYTRARATIDDIDSATDSYPEPCPAETWRARHTRTRQIIETYKQNK